MISFLHASTIASSSSAMLEQERRSTHDTTRHVKSRLARHVVLVVSWRTWRNKWNVGYNEATRECKHGGYFSNPSFFKQSSWVLSDPCHCGQLYSSTIKLIVW